MRHLSQPLYTVTKAYRYKRLLVSVLVLGLFGLLLAASPAEAHIEVPNNYTGDVINHLEGDVGAGETFRNWSEYTGAQAVKNPANPYCRKRIRSYTINDRAGLKRKVFKFDVVGNADGRAHNFEAGGFVDSTLNCIDETGGAWRADGTVDLTNIAFRNPVSGATLQRPVNVTVGVTDEDEDDNPSVRYSYDADLFGAIDYDEKISAGIKQSSDGGAFGAQHAGGGYRVNNQTIWCAGLSGIGNIQDYVRTLNSLGFTITTNVQWSGLFGSNCYHNYLFQAGNNDDGGIGNWQTRWGGFTAGAMGSNGAGWRNWFYNVGDEIPGFTRSGGMANNFKLEAAGFSNHDGTGTFNSNGNAPAYCKNIWPLYWNVDDCAKNVGDLNPYSPTPYEIAFVEAWFTMEWNPAGVVEPTPEVTCQIVTSPLDPEPGQPFNVRMNYTFTGEPAVLEGRGNFTSPGISNTVVNVGPESVGDSDTGGEVSGSFSMGSYTAGAGVYDFDALLRIRDRITIRDDCDKRVVVAAKPYFKVWTNDVKVGGAFEESGVCTPSQGNPLATAIGYGGSEGDSPPASNQFSGSSVEFGLFALGEVRNVFSAGRRSDRGGEEPTPPHGLTFANASIDGLPTGDPDDSAKALNYGGGSRIDDCARDWFSPDLVPTSVNNLPSTFFFTGAGGSGATRVTRTSGNFYINSGTVTGARSIFVPSDDVDVVISGNITANNGATMYIIANGDIRISKNVTRIDAVLISKKRVITCTEGNGTLIAASDLYEECGGDDASSKLIIRGAVVAQELKLLRTFGTREDSAKNEGPTQSGSVGNEAAEEILFDPTLYRASPALRTPETQGAQFDFITSLPPIL